jgi:hypothetical protein
MSGQPVNKPLDAERFRKEYLRSLNQQVRNDEKNLRANMLFIKTGTPQQPMDTRSVEERLMDKEALKPEIRSQLLSLMDGGEAEKVVQNASEAQLTTMINAMPYLIATLKPKFQRGMFADAFLTYVNKYMESESRGGMESEQMMLKEDVSPLLEALQRMTTISDKMKSALRGSFSELERVLPSQSDVDSVNDEQDALLRQFGLDKLEEAYQDVPNKDDFYRELDDIMIREQSGDIRGFNDGLKRLGQMIDGAVVSAQVMPDFLTAEVVSDYIPVDELTSKQKPELQVYVKKVWARIGDDLLKYGIVDNPYSKTKVVIIDTLKKYDEIIRQRLLGGDMETPLVPSFAVPRMSLRSDASLPQAQAIPEGAGIKRRVGRGIRTGKPRATELKDTDIDWNSGVLVPKVPKYVPMGRYVIHQEKLKDNIVCLKTPSGQTLPDFKMIRVNDKVGGALRTVLSGGRLTYDQIGSLDESEKKYLSMLATKSGLGERLDVPAPDRKKDDQDINQFEIMKGQIMAGNDSELLIRDFKKMIVKLREKELLPKRQASDMLMELAREGY